MIAEDDEVASNVWWIHEAHQMARRQHPEVEEIQRPREEERYGELLNLGRRLKRERALPNIRVGMFADMLWGRLMNVGTYRNLVIERGRSLDQYRRWVRNRSGSGSAPTDRGPSHPTAAGIPRLG